MDLDRAMAMSFLLHLTVAGLLFFKFQNKAVTTSFSTVELIQIKASKEKPRKERKKGKKERVTQDLAKPKPEPADREEDSKVGDDSIDAEAIAGGNTNDPNLVAVATYAQELQEFIEKNRYYPRRALMMEQTGTVKVRLKINPDGYFANVEVIEPSSHAILNRAARDLVTELRSFKALPESYRGSGLFIIPINYQLRN